MRETREGETPNGGVRSEVVWCDDEWAETDRERATRAVVTEYDGEGNAVCTTQMYKREA